MGLGPAAAARGHRAPRHLVARARVGVACLCFLSLTAALAPPADAPVRHASAARPADAPVYRSSLRRARAFTIVSLPDFTNSDVADTRRRAGAGWDPGDP